MAFKKIYLDNDEFKYIINRVEAVSGDGICLRCAHVDKTSTYSEMAQGETCDSCGKDGVAGLRMYDVYRYLA